MCRNFVGEKNMCNPTYRSIFNPRMGQRKSVVCCVLYKKCPRSVKVKRRCNSVMGSVLIFVTYCCHKGLSRMFLQLLFDYVCDHS